MEHLTVLERVCSVVHLFQRLSGRDAVKSDNTHEKKASDANNEAGQVGRRRLSVESCDFVNNFLERQILVMYPV